MLADELDGLLNAHAFLSVERPPSIWAPSTDLESFLCLLGEMIAAGLVQNGGSLSEVVLNVSNVVVEPEASSEFLPPGEFVALTIRSGGETGGRS
jgi:hypothetical protein